MSPDNPTSVDVADLRVGLYVHLDIGWTRHPFPFGNFKISSQQQIDTIRSLGLQRVRFDPLRSDPLPQVSATAATATASPDVAVPLAAAAAEPAATEQQRRQALLDAQRKSQQQCERLFSEATRTYKQVLAEVGAQPEGARARSEALIGSMVNSMLSQGESAIRLLSDNMGDRAALHGVNVTVLSLLLGHELGLTPEALQHLGLAALLHDMGKAELPDRARYRDDNFTSAQLKLYQEHVSHGVAYGKRMGLPAPALLAMSQHHELADGSGFPLGLRVEKISPAARVLALVNRYDGLCNPTNPIHALTPHEALSLIFSQSKARFDSTTLNAFIRMMGIFPPGSVVQLSDNRYAMVVSVNSARPLKPRVLVHDPAVEREKALLLDLESTPELGIARNVRPLQLPKAALEFLSPRQRVCYFFERAVEAPVAQEGHA